MLLKYPFCLKYSEASPSYSNLFINVSSISLTSSGDIFKDNLFYLKRCGFDSFAVRADKDLQVALQGLTDFSESYQASIDESQPLYRRRLAS